MAHEATVHVTFENPIEVTIDVNGKQFKVKTHSLIRLHNAIMRGVAHVSSDVIVDDMSLMMVLAERKAIV